MSKKKSHTLDVKPDKTPILFGIISSENDYSLSFKLNQALDIQLTKQDDLVFERKNKPPLYFSSFYFSSPDETTGYQLLKNKSQSQVLVPQFKTTDYFMLVFGENDPDEITALQETLKQIPGINVVMLLDFTEIKLFNKLFL